MTLHLLKLCVGIGTLSDLAAWQTKCLKDRVRLKQKPELVQDTRNMPKRRAELLDGGSLYWVIKGWICARQSLLDLRQITREGVTQCGLVLDPELVPVQLRPCRAFQGWRYLEAKDAPPDQTQASTEAELPEELKRELSALGLL